MLRRNDLIMYDRESETLWQQITGEGIVGVEAGTQLEFLPSQIVAFGDFKATFPESEVLLGPVGSEAVGYEDNPYVYYDSTERTYFANDEFDDHRLDAKERVLTVELNGDPVAFPFSALSERVVIEAEVGGVAIVALWQPRRAVAARRGVHHREPQRRRRGSVHPRGRRPQADLRGTRRRDRRSRDGEHVERPRAGYRRAARGLDPRAGALRQPLLVRLVGLRARDTRGDGRLTAASGGASAPRSVSCWPSVDAPRAGRPRRGHSHAGSGGESRTTSRRGVAGAATRSRDAR